MADLAALAERLDTAARSATAITQITNEVDLSQTDAYEIGGLVVGRRLARGEKRIGIKMGLTSRAKMAQVGVDELVWGRLTDGMRVEDGGSARFGAYIHPRIEPEIAFVLDSPLAGEVSPAEALDAVAAVAPAMELIDSRYKDFQFTLEDVAADNCSAAGLVVGPWQAPDIDFSNLGIVMEVDGRAVQIGSSAAILGHPLRSLAAAARLAGKAGERLEPGWIVLAGGATAARALVPGMHVRTVIQELGAVGCRIDP